MLKKLQHIILTVLLTTSLAQAKAQVAMPDSVCIGTTRKYHVNNPGVPSTYTWTINGITQSTTSNEITITWNTPGVFQLTVTEHANNGCDGDPRSGLVYVSGPPVADAGRDFTICYGTTATLNGSGGTIYHWTPATYLSNSGIASPVAAPPLAGTYIYALDVTNAFGCKSIKTDSVVLTVLPPVKVFAGNDTIITLNQPLQLNATELSHAGIVSWSWSPSFGLNNPNIQGPVARLTQETTYIVTGRSAEGCIGRDDIRVQVFAKADLYVPTAFTPNGDGRNDFAVVIPAGIRELRFFRIFNRWGDLVFSTSNAAKGWDGNLRGIKQNGDVFVWEAEGVDFTGRVIFKKGTVALIR